MLGYNTEAEYEADCALEARSARMAALAVNEMMTEAQAQVLLLAMSAFPAEAGQLAEVVFEAYGWPHDDLDASWLDQAGRATWAAFQAYRRGGV